jgi:hypothetical protein
MLTPRTFGRGERWNIQTILNLAPYWSETLTDRESMLCVSVFHPLTSAVWFSSRMQLGILARGRATDGSAGAYTLDIGPVGEERIHTLDPATSPDANDKLRDRGSQGSHSLKFYA